MTVPFDYEGAKKAGFSDDEIASAIGEEANFDTQGAISAGYTPQDIITELSGHKFKPQRGGLEKAARVGAQAVKGAIVGTPIGMMAESVLGVHKPRVLSKAGKEKYKDTSFFTPISPKEGEYEELNLTPSHIFEKLTSVGAPEGFAEEMAHWVGMIKSAGGAKQMIAGGPKKFMKTLALQDLPAGAGAAAFEHLAEENEWGPIGKMVGATAGLLLGHVVPKGIGKGVEAIKAPKVPKEPGAPRMNLKEAFGRAAASMSKFRKSGEELATQRALIEEARKAGIQLDLPTLSNTNLFKALQARLAASGLVGPALDQFRKQSTQEFIEAMKPVYKHLGERKMSSPFEIGEAAEKFAKEGMEANKKLHTKLYEQADKRAAGKKEYAEGLVAKIGELEGKLEPGILKSPEQRIVLDQLEKLTNEVLTPEGQLKPVSISALMNNRRALRDLMDFHVQGGAKKLLESVVDEIDNALNQFAKKDPEFGRLYREANKQFGKHAETFRNPNIAKLIRGSDPGMILKRLGSKQGIRQMRDALSHTPEGKRLFAEMSAAKFEELVLDNMIDGTTNQIKYGTFSNILDKGRNREILKELLGSQRFGMLERLTKLSGSMAESAQKYLNTSKTASTAIDTAIGVKALKDLGHLLYGNPYPLMRTGATWLGARYLTRMMTDPVFLRSVEEGILAGKANKIPKMQTSFQDAMAPIVDIERNGFQYTRENRGFAGEVPEGFTELEITGRPKEPKRQVPIEEDIEFGPRPEPTPEKLKSYSEAWGKWKLPPELFHKFYDPRVRDLGTLGDWIKDPKIRKYAKDVLNVRIGKLTSEYGGFGQFFPFNEEIATKVYSEAVEKGLTASQADKLIPKPNVNEMQIKLGEHMHPQLVLESLYHEGWHAVQYVNEKTGLEFWKSPFGLTLTVHERGYHKKYLRGSLHPRHPKRIPYLHQKSEIGARLIGRYPLRKPK